MANIQIQEGCQSERLRKLQNERLHSFYRSSNIVRVIKSRILRWAGHVARMGEYMGVFRMLTGKPAGK